MCAWHCRELEIADEVLNSFSSFLQFGCKVRHCWQRTALADMWRNFWNHLERLLSADISDYHHVYHYYVYDLSGKVEQSFSIHSAVVVLCLFQFTSLILVYSFIFICAIFPPCRQKCREGGGSDFSHLNMYIRDFVVVCTSLYDVVEFL